ncbi:hypothetical protein FGO68_gene6295 [Halteria grandinella]|uniref:EB1 C-terminal domain-containing protein n=1 Tax=Halteria grandinella TaxID=5974 RepID=A0A8J8NKA2_HALGN|nr:hypothetical protein FGO68_gene6295 [Halteria grandinella]
MKSTLLLSPLHQGRPLTASSTEDSHPRQSQSVIANLSKSELMKWASQELEHRPITSLKKFETGTIFLILISKAFVATYPEVLALVMKQLKHTQSEIDTLQNFKLCLKLLSDYSSNAETLKLPISQTLTVQMAFLDKLVKGKVQEITDMLQAIRKVFVVHYKPLTQADQQRGLAQLMDEYLPQLENNTGASAFIGSFKKHPLFEGTSGGAGTQSAVDSFQTLMQKSMQIAQDLESVMNQNQELKAQCHNQHQKTEAAERERDFYFGKLRDIELLLFQQENQKVDGAKILKAIQKVLHAKEDENIEVDDEGNIVV